MLHSALEQILPRVQKPARYVGGEWGSVTKDKNNIDLHFAFCFPDVYEVGMSHLGSRILYGLLNDQKNIWCERVFAPWIDMEAEMRKANIPLYGLESGTPYLNLILSRSRCNMNCPLPTFSICWIWAGFLCMQKTGMDFKI